MPLDIGWYYGYDPEATPDMYEYVLGATIGYDSSMSYQVSVEAAAAHPFTGEILDLIRRYEQLRLSGRVPAEMQARLRVDPKLGGPKQPEERGKLLDHRREYRLLGEDGKEVFQRVIYEPWREVSGVGAEESWPVTVTEGPVRVGFQVHARPGVWLAPGPSYHASDSLTLETFDDLAPYTAIPADRDVRVLQPGGFGAVNTGVTQSVELPDDAAQEGARYALYRAENTRQDSEGWSVFGKSFDPPLDLSWHAGIGFWLRGDGQGGLFKLQLTDDSGAIDYYIANDFTGWRYQQLARPAQGSYRLREGPGAQSLLQRFAGADGGRLRHRRREGFAATGSIGIVRSVRGDRRPTSGLARRDDRRPVLVLLAGRADHALRPAVARTRTIFLAGGNRDAFGRTAHRAFHVSRRPWAACPRSPDIPDSGTIPHAARSLAKETSLEEILKVQPCFGRDRGPDGQRDSRSRGRSQPRTTASAQAPVNLALVANASTSYVSGHETITALNDGDDPAHSDDKSQGAYGNWPKSGTQWVQYEWSQPISTNKIDVYWFDDARGVRLPRAVRVLYWDGGQFVPVAELSGLGLAANQYNTGTFANVQTTRLRLELDSQGTFSTGLLEWKVYDSGNSPNFPPSVEAGADRVVVLPGKTYLNGVVKDDGKVNAAATVTWSCAVRARPGCFRKRPSGGYDRAVFRGGGYVLKLTAHDGEASSSDTLQVSVDPPPPVAHLAAVPTNTYQIDSPLWSHRIKRLIVNWIPHCYAKISDLNVQEGGIENFVQAGNKLAGRPHTGHQGPVFANAWVHNTVESMCVALHGGPAGRSRDPRAQQAIREKLDDWIPKILAQEPDGYLQTFYTLNDRPRWTNRHDHEGYLAGYFLESAIAHYQMTNRTDARMYEAAKKLADCWCDNIGPAPKKSWYEGHQELEQALVRLGSVCRGRGRGGQRPEVRRAGEVPHGQPPRRRGVRPEPPAGHPAVRSRGARRARRLFVLGHGRPGDGDRRRRLPQRRPLAVGQSCQQEVLCDGRRRQRRNIGRLWPGLLASQPRLLRIVRGLRGTVLPAQNELDPPGRPIRRPVRGDALQRGAGQCGPGGEELHLHQRVGLGGGPLSVAWVPVLRGQYPSDAAHAPHVDVLQERGQRLCQPVHRKPRDGGPGWRNRCRNDPGDGLSVERQGGHHRESRPGDNFFRQDSRAQSERQ